MQLNRIISWLLLLFLPSGGCFLVTDFDDLDTTRRETFELPFRKQGEIPHFDILFVVDRPLSDDAMFFDAMDDLAIGAPGLIDGMSYTMSLPEVNTRDGGSLHIGVISSNLGSGEVSFAGCDVAGDEGRLLDVDPLALADAGIAGCGWLNEPYLHVMNETVVNMVDDNNDPMEGVTVDHAVRCLVMSQMIQPTDCRIRQPLGAFQRAVFDHNHGVNAGFLRDDAGLAVVFITSQDDCSADDPSLYAVGPSAFGPYTCFTNGLTCEERPGSPGVYDRCDEPDVGGVLLSLRDLHADVGNLKPQSRLVISVMSGPFGESHPVEVLSLPDLPPTLKETCGSRQEGLYGLPGVRLELFRRKFAENSVFHEICDPQVNQLYSRLSQKLAAQLTYRCMPYRPADADGDPSNGRQVDCLVRDVRNPDTINPVQSDNYPHCDHAPQATTCWEVMAEENCQSGFKMVLSRQVEPEDDHVVVADCAIDVTYEPPPLLGGQ